MPAAAAALSALSRGATMGVSLASRRSAARSPNWPGNFRMRWRWARCSTISPTRSTFIRPWAKRLARRHCSASASRCTFDRNAGSGVWVVIARAAKQSHGTVCRRSSAMITADLTGKTALVTGGASGIGLATVEAFARAGATVALNHLADDPRGAEQVARLKAAGHRVIAAPGNVATPGEAEQMTSRAIDALGRLDFLFNNAGTPATPAPIPFAEFDRLTEDFWQAILNTNLIGP